MFNIGTGELLLILAIVMLLFGGSRLPELGRGLGQGFRSFRDAIKGTDERRDERADEKNPSNTAGTSSNK